MPPTPTALSPAANGSRSTGNGRSARISRRWPAPAPRSSRRAEPTDHVLHPPPTRRRHAAAVALSRDDQSLRFEMPDVHPHLPEPRAAGRPHAGAGQDHRRAVPRPRARGAARDRRTAPQRGDLRDRRVSEIPCADRGVDEVYVQRLVFNGLGLATAENALHGRLHRQEQELLDQAEELAHALGLALRASGLTTPLVSLTGGAPSPRPWAGCQRPWTLSYVTANGNVLPCCISPWVARNYQALILGNALAEPFADIWNGERYRRFRINFESASPPDPCRGCGLLWSI